MKIKYTLAILLLTAILPMKAQEVQWSIARQFNIAILGILDEYERTSTLSEQNDRQAFLRLFLDKDATCLYNDILGTADFQKSISPAQYVSSIPEDGNFLLQSEIRDIRKEGDCYWEGGLLHRKISFSKNVMIIDSSVYSEGEGGVLFDSAQAFPHDPDFRLVADFVFDPERGDCFILEIVSEANKTASPLDEEKFSIVVKSSTKYDKQLTTNGESLQFNSFDQSVAYYNNIDIQNQDVYVEPVEYAKGQTYNVLGLKFHPMHFRGKVYGEMTLGNAFDVRTASSVISATSTSKTLGCDFGFETTVTGSWRAGIYAGIALSSSQLNLALAQVSYTLLYIQPARAYNFSGSENATLLDLMIPLYLENEFTLSRHLVLDLDLGAKVYLNHETKLSPFRVSGLFAGKQEDHSFTAMRSPANYSREIYDISLFGRAELDFCIVKRLLYVYASYGYEKGIKPLNDSSVNPFYNPTGNIYPVFFSPQSGKDVPFRSMIGSITYTRKASWLSGGLKIKF